MSSYSSFELTCRVVLSLESQQSLNPQKDSILCGKLVMVVFYFSFVMKTIIYEKELGRERETKRERKKKRAQLDVARLVRLPNVDHVVMGSTPTFHNGIQWSNHKEVVKLGCKPNMRVLARLIVQRKLITIKRRERE